MEIIAGELIAKDLQFLDKKKEELKSVIKRTNAKLANDEMDVMLRVE